MPVDLSIAIQHKTTTTPLLSQRTRMPIPQIVTLLEFCLKNTCFIFQSKHYEQGHGEAMDSSISFLIANLFLEEFEVKAINTYPTPASMARYVDDTATNFSSTLIHGTHTFSSLQRTPIRMVPYPSWTLWFPQAWTAP